MSSVSDVVVAFPAFVAGGIGGGHALMDRILAVPLGARELADLLIAKAEPLVKYLASPGEPRRSLANP